MNKTEMEHRKRNAAYAVKSRAKKTKLVEEARIRFAKWLVYYRAAHPETVDGENVAARIADLENALTRLQRKTKAYDWLVRLSADSPLRRLFSKRLPSPPPAPPRPPPPPQHDEHFWMWLQVWKAKQINSPKDYADVVAHRRRNILLHAGYYDRRDRDNA